MVIIQLKGSKSLSKAPTLVKLFSSASWRSPSFVQSFLA